MLQQIAAHATWDVLLGYVFCFLEKYENITVKEYANINYKNMLKYESALAALRFFWSSEVGPNMHLIPPSGIVRVLTKGIFPCG